MARTVPGPRGAPAAQAGAFDPAPGPHLVEDRPCPTVAGPCDVLKDVPMTGDGLPAAAGPGAGGKPELRASDDDRDRAVERLRVAAGDGRPTAAELDERLSAALTARTSGELAALTADLPEAGGIAAQAKDVVRLDYEGGNAARRGRWIVPQRMEIRAVGGTVKLDFTRRRDRRSDAAYPGRSPGGRLVLVTRPGIEVDADDVAVRGGRVKVRPEHGWKEPVSLKIEVSGTARGGHLVVRSPHRTFWQWVLRRPGRASGRPGTDAANVRCVAAPEN